MTELLSTAEIEEYVRPVAEGKAEMYEITAGEQEPVALWRAVMQVLSKPEFKEIEAVIVNEGVIRVQRKA